MSIRNDRWHAKHPLPADGSEEHVVDWHVRHAAFCGCEPVPAGIAARARHHQRTIPRTFSANDPDRVFVSACRFVDEEPYRGGRLTITERIQVRLRARNGTCDDVEFLGCEGRRFRRGHWHYFDSDGDYSTTFMSDGNKDDGYDTWYAYQDNWPELYRHECIAAKHAAPLFQFGQRHKISPLRMFDHWLKN